MQREDLSVLIVDDVNAMRVQIRDLFKSFGFQKVTTANNGEEAKNLIKTKVFHLIMADWHMEPTDGLGLLQYVRSQPSTKDICFIMITAESVKELVIQAIKAGVDDYLVKPITMNQIESKVHAVLAKKQVLV